MQTKYLNLGAFHIKLTVLLVFGTFFVVNNLSAQTKKLDDKYSTFLKQIQASSLTLLNEGVQLEFTNEYYDVIPGTSSQVSEGTLSQCVYEVAIKKNQLLVTRYKSGPYDPATKKFRDEKNAQYQAAYNKVKYTQYDGSSINVTKDITKAYIIPEMFSHLPLTSMYQFLVPRKGDVTYDDVASPQNWVSYIGDITSIEINDKNNLVVQSSRSDGIKQTVTFDRSQNFAPSEIVLYWPEGKAIIKASDWIQFPEVSQGGSSVPGIITTQIFIGGKELSQERSTISIKKGSLKLLKGDLNDLFTLTINENTLIRDLDE